MKSSGFCEEVAGGRVYYYSNTCLPKTWLPASGGLSQEVHLQKGAEVSLRLGGPCSDTASWRPALSLCKGAQLCFDKLHYDKVSFFFSSYTTHHHFPNYCRRILGASLLLLFFWGLKSSTAFHPYIKFNLLEWQPPLPACWDIFLCAFSSCITLTSTLEGLERPSGPAVGMEYEALAPTFFTQVAPALNF